MRFPLAERGYDVTGLDRDQVALAVARERAAALGVSIHLVEGDMRDLAASVAGPFDVCVCLWQSFGYFDAATNEDILRQMGDLLRLWREADSRHLPSWLLRDPSGRAHGRAQWPRDHHLRASGRKPSQR